MVRERVGRWSNGQGMAEVEKNDRYTSSSRIPNLFRG